MIIGTVGEFCELPAKIETPLVPRGEKGVDLRSCFSEGAACTSVMPEIPVLSMLLHRRL